MKNEQLREYCDAEFENIDTVKAELWSVVMPEKSKYSISELVGYKGHPLVYWLICSNNFNR